METSMLSTSPSVIDDKIDIKKEVRLNDLSIKKSFDLAVDVTKVKTEFVPEMDEINDKENNFSSKFTETSRSESSEVQAASTDVGPSAALVSERHNSDVNHSTKCNVLIKKEESIVDVEVADATLIERHSTTVRKEGEIAQSSPLSHSAVHVKNRPDLEYVHEPFLTAFICEESDENYSTELDPLQRSLDDDPLKLVQRHSKNCSCINCTTKRESQRKRRNPLKVNNENRKPKKSKNCSEKHPEVTPPWQSCRVCPARFKFLHNLKKHYTVDHSEYLCLECFSKFQLRSDFAEHLKNHPTKSPYFCAFCSFRSTVEAELKIHTRIHSAEKLFSCALCLKEFNKSYDLLNHLRDCKKEESSCIVCCAKFESKADLSKHLAAHSKEELISSVISKKCESKPSLMNRVGEELQPISSFSSETEIQQSEPDLSSQKQSFSCNLGPAKFKARSEVEEHKVTHVNEQASFSAESVSVSKTKGQNEENDAHHEERPHRCTSCAASFRYKCQLNQHLVAHSTERNFSCPQCSNKFKTKCALRRHLITHSSARPFCCKLCPASFKRNNHLKLHIASHSKKRLYCEVCFMRCKTEDDLRAHLLTHTEDRPIPV